MVQIKRRPGMTKPGPPAEKPGSGPLPSRRSDGRAPASGSAGAGEKLPPPVGRAPERLQDVMRNVEDRAVFGVDPEAAKRALQAFLLAERGQDRPYCTDSVSGGFTFDPQYGCYVHSDPACWKPSKAMYEACLRAGILGQLPLQACNGNHP